MALANGDSHFMAPLSIRCMARDLALLPAWMANNGDDVVVGSEVLQACIQMIQIHPLHLQVKAIADNCMTNNSAIQPWGWDAAITDHLTKAGISKDNLPTAEKISQWRKCSERITSHHVLTQMMKQWDDTIYRGESYPCYSLEELKSVLKKHPHTLLKDPLSSSGKGLRHVHGTLNASKEDWCRMQLKKRGYIMAEPHYQRIIDFAMEFYQDEQEGNHFIGYSLFLTDEHGSYEGNKLCSDKDIEQELCQYVSIADLDRIKEWVITPSLREDFNILPHYRGYWGIDMMITHNDADNSYHIHPCVEINLRLNMGILAHTLYSRFIVPQSKGFFYLRCFPTSEALQDFTQEQQKTHPANYIQGRILEGYCGLTPICTDTRYHAFMLVNR